MRFRTWIESDYRTQQMDAFPASAEVIRSGLQPQVDSEEIDTDEKAENDKIGAIDAGMQRLVSMVDGMDVRTAKMKKIKELLKDFDAKWSRIAATTPPREEDGLGSHEPTDDELNYRRANQPPPADPGTPIL
jgi:hypothetical protein